MGNAVRISKKYLYPKHIAAFFTLTKIQKLNQEHTCIHTCMHGYRHTGILFNLKKEVSSFAATQMNPEDIMIHEESQVGKN